MAAAGTRPAGIPPEAAADHVRRMFDGIAPTYDLGNHLLSLHLDRWWRRHAARRMRQWLALGGGEAPLRILDVCCGTGDLTRALARACGGSEVFGADFSHGMLVRARQKFAGRPGMAWLETDAMRLPWADGVFAGLASGFGFRNLVDYRGGLAEFYRVLRPGGVLAILECSLPPSRLLAPVYKLYFNRILPVVGSWLSGSDYAYRYLPESVSRFPVPEELADWMRAAGFAPVSFERLHGGLVTLHLARKPV